MVGPGWRRTGPDPALSDWAAAALPLAHAALASSDDPLRCGGTWAVGLDLLPNDDSGTVGGVALPWDLLGLPRTALHPAQVSVIHPGYPQPSPDESDAAFGFRRNRDAAHLDGVLPVGPARRRMVKEPHGFILGLPLAGCGAGASPLVVWEGSHLVMRTALQRALQPHPQEFWNEVDITEAYTAARAEVFANCRRVEVVALPGEAVLLHRLLIHGVAPWRSGDAPRLIAYFRPVLPSVAEWLMSD